MKDEVRLFQDSFQLYMLKDLSFGLEYSNAVGAHVFVVKLNEQTVRWVELDRNTMQDGAISGYDAVITAGMLAARQLKEKWLTPDRREPKQELVYEVKALSHE